MLARIENEKVVVKEPRSGPDMFQEAMDNYYDGIEESTRNSGVLYLKHNNVVSLS